MTGLVQLELVVIFCLANFHRLASVGSVVHKRPDLLQTQAIHHAIPSKPFRGSNLKHLVGHGRPMLAGLQGPRKVAGFSLGSILDAAIPMLHPIVAAGSSRCESFKKYLGVTFEQIQEKNASDFYKTLSIDLITKEGNLKYNLTNRLGRVFSNANNIIILIHGFLESSNGWMVNAVAPELLKLPDHKIFAVDGRHIMTIDYFKTTSYVRFIGMKLGTILGEIVQKGQDPSKITLIGHSLGAHIAGIAGKQVLDLTGQQLGRITGLDPAGPCFSTTGPEGRLDASDAALVDVIHTNGGMLGIKQPIGHKDFFPNNGMTQPGCFLSTCDHSRAWELYAESVVGLKHFPARKCESWELFKQGNCSKNEVAYLGFNSEGGTPGSYFLTTGSSEPFSLGPAGTFISPVHL